MMNDQQILDNAPEGYLSVDIDNGIPSGYTDLDIRSLSDIKTIVEQQKRIAELEKAWVDVNRYPRGTMGYEDSRKIFEPRYKND